MVRGILRLVLVLVVVAAAVAFFFGYRWGNGGTKTAEQPVATTGREAPLDPSRARAVGADVAEKVAIGANRAGDALADAGVTAKIKSKIALDDTMHGSSVSVETDDTTVTLTGHVETPAQKARANELARETKGVERVVDRITVQ